MGCRLIAEHESRYIESNGTKVVYNGNSYLVGYEHGTFASTLRESFVESFVIDPDRFNIDDEGLMSYTFEPES